MAEYDLGTARGTIEIDASSLGRSAAAFTSFGKGLLGIGALGIAGFGVAATAAAEFEKKMSAVKAVLGLSEGDLERVRLKALQLGQDTVFSAQEVASGMEDLAKAGLSAEEIINGAADAAVNLAAAAGGMKLDRAAEIAANAMRTFDLQAEDLVHVADVLAGAANVSTLEVEDLAVSMKYAGSVAAAQGVSIDELSTAFAILGDRGIKGSTAGTSMRGVLLSLTGASGPAKKALEELGIITEDGSNQFFDAAGNMKSLSDVAQILQDSTKNLTEEQKTQTFNQIFQRRAMSSALILADQGAAGFDRYAAAIGKISAADVAATKLDNLSGDVEILRGNLETLLITQGSAFQDMLRGWTQGLIKVLQWFTDLDKGTQKLILQIALFGGIFLVVAGSMLIFIGQMLKMYRTFRDLQKAIKLMTAAIKLMNTAWLTNPVVLVVAALIALGIAVYAAYKNFEPFRKFVDEAWQALQRFWDSITGAAVAAWQAFQVFWDNVMSGISTAIAFIKANWDLLLPILLGPLGAIILVWRRFGDDIKLFIGEAINAVVTFFTELPGKILAAVTSFWDAIFGFFSRLPGMMGDFASTAVEAVSTFFSEMPGKIGFALGLALGTLVRWAIDGVKTTIQFGTDVLAAIVTFFTQLPGKILEFLTSAYQNITKWVADGITQARKMGTEFLKNIVDFLTQLPGKVAGFLSTTASNIATFVTNGIAKAREVGTGILNGVVEFLTQLPGKVSQFMTQAVASLQVAALGAYTAAKEFGRNVIDAIVGVITGLPGTVSGIMGRVIQAFKDVIRAGFNAAKDFASGLWNGFKQGLGISSPSFIEEAMFSMTKNVKGELSTLQRQVKGIQALGQDLANIQPVANLGIAQGAGVIGAAAGAAQAGSFTPTATAGSTPREGDTFNINGADTKTALEISREIMFEKRVLLV